MIIPIDNNLFVLKTYIEAEELARRNPAELRDIHVAHLAVYDQKAAQSAGEKCQAARCRLTAEGTFTTTGALQTKSAPAMAEQLAELVVTTIDTALVPLRVNQAALEARVERFEVRLSTLTANKPDPVYSSGAGTKSADTARDALPPGVRVALEAAEAQGVADAEALTVVLLEREVPRVDIIRMLTDCASTIAPVTTH